MSQKKEEPFPQITALIFQVRKYNFIQYLIALICTASMHSLEEEEKKKLLWKTMITQMKSHSAPFFKLRLLFVFIIIAGSVLTAVPQMFFWWLVILQLEAGSRGLNVFEVGNC